MSVVDDPALAVAAARRLLAAEGGESAGAGHVSVRAAGEDAFWVSPFQYFDECLPEHVAKVGFDLERRAGTWTPSPAVAFHAAIYRGRPDVGSVIHTHSVHVSAFATTRRPIAAYAGHCAVDEADQVLFEDDGTRPAVEGDRIVDELGGRRVVLIKNHGAIVLGEDLAEATIAAIDLERAARLQLEAEAAGGSVLAAGGSVDRDVAARWAAGLRRLARDVPDVFGARAAR